MSFVKYDSSSRGFGSIHRVASYISPRSSDARPVALAVASGDRRPSASFGPQNISVTYDKGDVSMYDIAEPGSGGLGA